MITTDLHLHEVTDSDGNIRQFRVREFYFGSDTYMYGWYGLGALDENYAECAPLESIDAVVEDIRKHVAGEDIDIIEALLGAGMIREAKG